MAIEIPFCFYYSTGSIKLVGSGSSIVVFVKYGIIAQTPNPTMIGKAMTIIKWVIFFNAMSSPWNKLLKSFFPYYFHIQKSSCK